MTDAVERILAQWHAEKPGLDVSPMGIIGRLSRASLAVEARLDENFARHGIDASTFDALATLLRAGTPYRLTPAQLAQEAMISTSAVAQRLNKLEGRGLVTREANPSDKRSTVVALTEAGKELVEKVLPDHLAAERSILAGLSEDGLEILARLLAHIDEAARR